MSTEAIYESDTERTARLTGEQLTATAKTTSEKWSNEEVNLARLLIRALAGGDPHKNLASQQQKCWLLPNGSLMSHSDNHEQPVIRLSAHKAQIIYEAYITVCTADSLSL